MRGLEKVNKYNAVYLHKDHLSSPSLSLSPYPLFSFASCNSLRWLPVDCWELVVLKS